jgi:serine/threonine-protein kinase
MGVIRYEALGPLQAGEGSRAFLGLAISEDNKAAPVVIIWVPENAEKDGALLEKIRRETEHAAQLDHPNIVNVIGFARLEQGHARVVEFADGESLRRIIEVGRKLPLRIALRVLIDCCTGVHYAHVAGNDDGSELVHGDLRPETVLVSFSGVTKVTGYGALAFAPREVGGQRVKGRRIHTAPEQIVGGRNAYTVQTDVYLLGLMLYECLTGVVPWAEQGEFFDHAVLTLPLPPPSPGDMPPEYETIIHRACAKKAADRYATPLALRQAIEAVAGSDIASPEELAQYLESLFPQSHELRAARRHTIDAGIADFVRRQWAQQEKRETVPMMRAVQPPPPALPTPQAAPPAAPAAPVQAPAAAATAPAPQPAPPKPALQKAAPRPSAAWTQPDEDDEPRQDTGSTMPWLVLLAAFIAIIAGWWAWKKANEPIYGVDIKPPRAPVAEIDAGAPPVAAVPAPPPVEDAGAPEPVAVEPPPQPPEPVAPPTPEPPPEVLVTLQSSPPAEVLLDGKALGRTPWTGRLPPGRKVFTLQNKEQLLFARRVVTVRGEPVNESFSFEKGFVAVRAPEGAAIFINDVRVGTAPIRGEIPVYEGSHRILVVIGQSRWSEPFTLSAGQRVSFNVALQ